MPNTSIFRVEKGEIPEIPLKNWILALFHDEDKKSSKDALSITFEVFILIKEIIPSLEPKLDFRSKGYGPYSEKVALSMKQLLATNMLTLTEKDPEAFGGSSYVLTEAGAKKAEKILYKLPKTLRDELKLMDTVTTKMGIIGMIQYIYSIYPEYIFDFEGGLEIA
jgi:hypothetical protein